MAKLELQIGDVEFECEGDEGWVMKMYEKFLLDFSPKQGAAAKAPVVKTGKRGRPPLAKKEVPAALPKKEKPAKKVKAKKAKKVKAPKVKKVAKKPKVKKIKALPKPKKVIAPTVKPAVLIAPAAKPAVAPAPTVKALAPKKVPKVKKAPKPKKMKKAAKIKAKKVAPKPVAKAMKPALPTPTHEVKLLDIKAPTMPPRAVSALSEFLKANNASEMLMKKFLVTAVWLHFGGKARMKPNDINEALMGIGEGKFNRPTDSLKNNIKKGFCSRDGEKFFITELGFKQVKF